MTKSQVHHGAGILQYCLVVQVAVYVRGFTVGSLLALGFISTSGRLLSVCVCVCLHAPCEDNKGPNMVVMCFDLQANRIMHKRQQLHLQISKGTKIQHMGQEKSAVILLLIKPKVAYNY